ncbi:MAG: hypothetical protein HKN03_11375 [Acidimicrobiales bacterium]|nr:hypothetical protein [Acidimicrobiales bacterium]
MSPDHSPGVTATLDPSAPDAAAAIRSQRGRREWSVTSLIALLVFIFAPFAFTLVRIAEDRDESTAAAPDTLDFVADEGPSGITDWFESKVPGRELAVEFERSTTRVIDNRYAQAVADSPRVHLGVDGYLFLDDATNVACVSPTQQAEWEEEIAAATAIVQTSGRQFFLAIAPDRAIVIPEKLGEIQNDCQVANTAVIKHLATLPSVLDLGTVVNQEGHVSQLDTHWSPRGALEGAKAIVNTITPGLWTTPTITTTEIDRAGDLDGLVGYENTERLELPAIETASPILLATSETGTPGRPLVTARLEGATDLNLLVVHDSFGTYFAEDDPSGYRSGLAVDYLRPWYGTVANVRMAAEGIGVVGDEPTAGAARSADVITVLMAQRTLATRLGTGQLRLPLISALVDDLNPAPLVGPIPESGALVIDGLGERTSASVGITGPIRARADFDDRIVLLVDGGTEITIDSPARSVRFVALN